MFDITQFTPVETTFLHLKSPVDDNPLWDGDKPVGILLHAPGSAAYETANKKRTNRALARSKKKADLTADMLLTDNVEFLVQVTSAFDNLAYPPADDVTGEALFRALYGDRKMAWIVDQVTTHLGDWANFLPSSQTS